MAKIKDNDAVGLRLANPGLSMQDLDVRERAIRIYNKYVL